MASLGELERLTDEESTDLSNRVERFRAAWKADGATTLEWFLPPPGTRHRLAVLVSIVLDDMDRRAQAVLPFRVEAYLSKFPEDLTPNNVPVEILTHEYLLRHRCADRPPMDEYRHRFPTLYEAFLQHMREIPLPQPTALPSDTPITAAEVIPPARSSVTPPRAGATIRSLAPENRRPESTLFPPPGRVGELVVTDSVNITPVAQKPTGESTILPADTPYQLVRRIGSGAFGEVYEAFAPGGIRVAVKRILRTVDHPASRSEREALDAIKGLAHPFLLKTNAYWVFDDRLVIVMELADGSLGDRLEHYQKLGHTGVPPEELIPIFEQAAEALDYLHSQNVSHRDIKPENILILQGYAKVGDFGLAHLHHHTVTMVPNTVGTPAYMAPEMWKQKVSLQSDQYSFAATYVRTRLGRHLFSSPVLVEQANSHIHDMPNLDPLPAEEQKVLLKALAKEPEDRFATCSEFAKALRAAVFPAPEPPPPPPPPSGSGRGALWGALMVAVACALTVAIVLRFSPRQEDAKKDENDKDKIVVVSQPAPEKFASYPRGWKPPDGVGVKKIDDKFYHRKLTRTIGDRELTAHLIYPTSGNDHDPYYMLEDKITNKVFNSVWDRISGEEQVKDIASKKAFAPGKWRKDEAGNPLDLNGADADRPVLGVTVPEAMLVAQWLGGALPSLKQWQKATGVLEDDAVYGPAGKELDIPPQFNKNLTPTERRAFNFWRSEQLQQRNLALGLREPPDRPKPLPVRDPRASGDKSHPWEIRQLVSNGQEWLDQANRDPNSRIVLSTLPLGEQLALVVGHHPRDLVIDSATVIRTEEPASWPWTQVEGVYAGFRIVLIPR